VAEKKLATPVEGNLLPGSKPADALELPDNMKIPMVDNARVRRWVEYFTQKDRERFQRFLNRGDHYRQVVEDTLEENELPAELFYLAMIESGFRPEANSVAKAAGVWQFIPGTARRYGLRVDRYVDERRDPIRATEAAAKYLKDLYNAFGSWHLAMAAYNAGELRVLRAIFRGKSRDFWELAGQKVLPPETANYVPKFLAVVSIGQNPEKYGFKIDESEFPDVEAVELPASTPIALAASSAGMPVGEFKKLNPNLRRDRLPPDDYEVWVPTSRVAQLKGAHQKLLVASRRLKRAEKSRALASVSGAFHRVKRGENLGLIASRYKISVRHLKRLNRLRGNKILVGMKLRVRSGSYKGSKLVRYKVKRGDNLITIAHRFGVPVSRLKRSNRIRSNKILVGQTLTISPEKL
jgi:membrane-bound lytic murein transglycosylase D